MDAVESNEYGRVRRARVGRDRDHVAPGRVHRINPTFTASEHAATLATGEADFFARLGHSGIKVKLRRSSRNPSEVTGYAVALPGHTTAAGQPICYGGGRLAPTLTLPQLRIG